MVKVIPKHWLPIALFLLGLFALTVHGQNKPIRLRNEFSSPSASPEKAAANPGKDKDQIITGLRLVQFTGPFQSSWEAQLQGLGVQLLRYVPEDAFIAQFSNVRLNALRALPFVS